MAFISFYIPLIQIPFSWFMTFFHEISHGIAALLTGGSILKIELHLRGSGLCYTSGGVHFLILQAGYIGAVVWGFLIYLMAEQKTRRKTNALALFLAGLIALSAILFTRDLITGIILLFLFTLFVSITKLQRTRFTKLSLKFIGMYILLDGVRAPLHLIDGRHYGDGAMLADITMVPEFVWLSLWFFIGVSAVLFLLKRTN